MKYVIAAMLALFAAPAQAEWFNPTERLAATFTDEGGLGFQCTTEGNCGVVFWQDDMRCDEGAIVPGLFTIEGEAIRDYEGGAHVEFHCVSDEPDADGDYLMLITFRDISVESQALFLTLGDRVRVLSINDSHEFLAYTFSLAGSAEAMNKVLQHMDVSGEKPAKMKL